MRLHFVSAPGGSAFMHELLGVVAHEVSALGPASPVDEVTVSEGPLPAGDADDVYVVVPHEYFVVLPARSAPGAEQLARYKLPEDLTLLDALPLTPMDKIDRRTLARDVAASDGASRAGRD